MVQEVKPLPQILGSVSKLPTRPLGFDEVEFASMNGITYGTHFLFILKDQAIKISKNNVVEKRRQ